MLEEASFYRSADNNKHVKFSNQTRNLDEIIDELEDEYYGEDDMPELFDPENREDVEFDSFDNYSEKSQIFQKSLLRFPDVDNQVFFMLFSMVLCTVSLMDKVSNFNLLKEF